MALFLHVKRAIFKTFFISTRLNIGSIDPRIYLGSTTLTNHVFSPPCAIYMYTWNAHVRSQLLKPLEQKGRGDHYCTCFNVQVHLWTGEYIWCKSDINEELLEQGLDYREWIPNPSYTNTVKYWVFIGKRFELRHSRCFDKLFHPTSSLVKLIDITLSHSKYHRPTTPHIYGQKERFFPNRHHICYFNHISFDQLKVRIFFIHLEDKRWWIYSVK